MKAKKKRKQKSKIDGAKIAPTSKNNFGVHPDSTSDHIRGKNTEKVTHRKDVSLDEPPPSYPSQTFVEGRPDGSRRQLFTDTTIAEWKWKMWEPRLARKIHFERWGSLYDGDFHLLFFRGNVLVSAADLARAATLADRLEPALEYTMAEIVDMVDVRDLIAVPGSEVHGNFHEAFLGIYLPLEILVEMLCNSGFDDDVIDFEELLRDFEERKAWQQEAELQETWLRKERMRAVDTQALRRWKSKLLSEGRKT